MDQYKNLLDDFNKYIKRYNKIIVWGLKTKVDTYRHIQHHFFTTLKKLGANVIWLDDKLGNVKEIKEGDFVISARMACDNLPYLNNVTYCLHDLDADQQLKFMGDNVLRLAVYSNFAIDKGTKLNEITYFDKKNRTLYQPWGTNLLPWEFKEPVFNKRSSAVFWIGSIWNNALNQGNIKEIAELKHALLNKRLAFLHVSFVPDIVNMFLVRRSRIAPAIAGGWQVENNYLPCRMFKNISYGQLGISNVPKFKDLFKGCSLASSSIDDLVEEALSMKEDVYKGMVLSQQKICKNHTYLNKLLNIFHAFG